MSQLLTFQTKPPKSIFAPVGKYYIFEDNISNVLNFNTIKNTILKKEKEIIKKYPFGDELFKVCFPKSFKNSNRLSQSYLSIMVKRGHEVDLEYSKTSILKKLNSYLGYNAVEKLKFVSFEDEELGFKEKINKDATNNEYKEKISKIKNDKVKKSLIELSKYFKKK